MHRMMMVFAMAGLTTGAVAADLGKEVRAAIPFEFMVGAKRMPAGQYTVKDIGVRNTVIVHDLDYTNCVVFYPVGVRRYEGAPETVLVFDKLGEQRFLREVWPKGSLTGVRVIAGRMEKQLLAEAEKENIAAVAAR